MAAKAPVALERLRERQITLSCLAKRDDCTERERIRFGNTFRNHFSNAEFLGRLGAFNCANKRRQIGGTRTNSACKQRRILLERRVAELLRVEALDALTGWRYGSRAAAGPRRRARPPRPDIPSK